MFTGIIPTSCVMFYPLLSGAQVAKYLRNLSSSHNEGVHVTFKSSMQIARHLTAFDSHDFVGNKILLIES